MLIGYMLNCYDDYGPEDIYVIAPTDDLFAAVSTYCENYLVPAHGPLRELHKLREFLNNPAEINQPYFLSYGWGGLQITALAYTQHLVEGGRAPTR
jgi:hypothetical protein